MSEHGNLTGRSRLVVIVSVLLVALAVVLGAARLWTYIADRSATDRRLTAIAEQNRINGEILVNCTTPTPAPTPENPTPAVHECYERGGAATAGAIAVIVVDMDCRHRRAQARLAAPPDPYRPCADQTPASVYPGVEGQPSK